MPLRALRADNRRIYLPETQRRGGLGRARRCGVRQFDPAQLSQRQFNLAQLSLLHDGFEEGDVEACADDGARCVACVRSGDGAVLGRDEPLGERQPMPTPDGFTFGPAPRLRRVLPGRSARTRGEGPRRRCPVRCPSRGCGRRARPHVPRPSPCPRQAYAPCSS